MNKQQTEIVTMTQCLGALYRRANLDHYYRLLADFQQHNRLAADAADAGLQNQYADTIFAHSVRRKYL